MLDGYDLLVVFSVTLLCFMIKHLFFRGNLPLPPGPRGLPLVGNLLDIPSIQAWKVYADWREQWGDLIYMNALGQPIVIVQSLQMAIDLLDKRSNIYSDRPIFPMFCEIIGWKYALAVSRYGNHFRKTRKLIARVIGTRGCVSKFSSLQERQIHRFLARVLARPQDLTNEVRKTIGGIMLMLSHGYQVQEENDPIVALVELATDQFSKGAQQGAFLVETFPLLRYAPQWFPGGGWKKIVNYWRKTVSDMVEIPHQFVKQQLDTGTAMPSYTSDLLSAEDLSSEDEFTVKWSAAAIYGGGTETTVSTFNMFFLIMSLFPDVQKKAQAEIDSVIGTGRLPTSDDRDSLPYIECIVKEVLRWGTVVPLNLPHRLTKDDMYNGYLIPEGSIVIVNLWLLLHDPQTYSNPGEFKPDRFMGSTPEKDPREIFFGYGRRACPGQHMAESSLFIACAMSLAVFNISKGVDEFGGEIEPVLEFTEGTIRQLKPFKCTIKARSDDSLALINAAAYA